MAGIFRPLTAFLAPCVLALCLFYGCAEDRLLRIAPESPPSSSRCADCHAEVHLEWQTSPHARAWINEVYLRSLEETGTMACWPCHAPEARHPGGGTPPALRKSNLDEGVNCAACHGAQCPEVVLISSVSPPDSAVRSDSRICGDCHRVTFREWEDYISAKASNDGPQTCWGCHMPALGGAVSGPHRSHAFTAISDTGVRVEVAGLRRTRNRDWEALVQVHSDAAGHRLPSGVYGNREMRLELWIDERSPESIRTKRFFTEMGSALAPGRNGPFIFRVPGDGAMLRVRVIRIENGESTILDEKLQRLPGKRTSK
jgi:hypothetical protein